MRKTNPNLSESLRCAQRFGVRVASDRFGFGRACCSTLRFLLWLMQVFIRFVKSQIHPNPKRSRATRTPKRCAPNCFTKMVVNFVVVFVAVVGLLNASTAEEVFAKKAPLTIGIISAVPAERGPILEHMESCTSHESGGRTYYRGKLYGFDTVLVASRIGKVAAAATAVHLILKYDVDLIIFVGVAGAIDPSLNVGDVVVANSLIQHDMDARPFCPVYEIPLLKIKECRPDPLLNLLAMQASQQFMDQKLVEDIPRSILEEFNITRPAVKTGLILTGDQVISRNDQKAQLREQLPLALCVEMEGASIGQVCYEYGIPYAVIRTISDHANHHHTPVNARKFIERVSGGYSSTIVENIYSLIRTELAK